MRFIHCISRAQWENTACWLLFNLKAVLCKIFQPNSATFSNQFTPAVLGNMHGFSVNVEKRVLWAVGGAR